MCGVVVVGGMGLVFVCDIMLIDDLVFFVFLELMCGIIVVMVMLFLVLCVGVGLVGVLFFLGEWCDVNYVLWIGLSYDFVVLIVFVECVEKLMKNI